MYNNSSCSEFSCSYSACSSSKFYSSSNSSIDNVVYSMSDNINGGDTYSSNGFEDCVNKAYSQEDYKETKIDDEETKLNTSAGIDSFYLVGQQNFNPMSFLNPERPKAKFITNIEELTPVITETFEALTGESFPDNISVKICDEDELKNTHKKQGGVWVPSIQGFSLNRNGKGVNEIFIKKDALDSMMMTIGHEIGHVMTPTLKNPVDEEGKAFAFSLAWIEKIKENNIADLGANICPNPAKNGLHDRAFDFVIKVIKSGKSAFQAFKEIANCEFKSKNMIECEVY